MGKGDTGRQQSWGLNPCLLHALTELRPQCQLDQVSPVARGSTEKQISQEPPRILSFWRQTTSRIALFRGYRGSTTYYTDRWQGTGQILLRTSGNVLGVGIRRATSRNEQAPRGFWKALKFVVLRNLYPGATSSFSGPKENDVLITGQAGGCQKGQKRKSIQS